ncbi:MAG: hypothetical protein WA688_05605 [Thermoplasmata archaeon]
MGASAALAGLIFVGLSINLQRIISLPTIANRALQAILLLVAVLAVSSTLLVPGQSGLARGIEVLVIAVPLWVGLDWIEVRNWRAVQQPMRRFLRSHTIEIQFPCALLAGGGILLAVGSSGALEWFAAATIAGFLVTILEAWVLLVEINR